MQSESKVPTVETCRKLWNAGLRLETERTWRQDLRGFSGPTYWRLNSETAFTRRLWDLPNEGHWWLAAPDLTELLLVAQTALPVNIEEVNAETVAGWILEDIALGNLTVAEVNERTKGE